MQSFGMAKITRGVRRTEELRRRRIRAGHLFEAGASQASVAQRLDVSRVSAMRWYKAWKAKGHKGLKPKGPLGRPNRLTRGQRKQVETALLKGPSAHGYSTDLWTLPRVAAVIEHTVGVRYHPGHVWRVLRQLGWSLQRPAKRARERNEDAIQGWQKERWPRLKKTSEP
jgi:transposase